MKILILEDELPASAQLRSMLLEIDPVLQIVASLRSVEAALEWLQSNTEPDLILSDIQLLDGISFDVFSAHPISCPVIFTTAYDQFAIRAFEVNSIDYLLKPIDPEELKKAFEKWKSRSVTELPSAAKIDLDSIVLALREKNIPAYKKRFLVKQGQRLIPVDISEIAFFYTEDKVSFIRTFTDQRYMVDHSLDELEELLDPEDFFRANRQFIVSPKSLDGIHHHFNGKLKVNLRPVAGDEVFVSRERAAEFKNWLGEN